jgi:hypothetical protein
MISQFRKNILRSLTVVVALSGFFTAAGPALAQAPTRIQVATDRTDGVLSLTAKVSDVGGAPVSEGSVSFETAKGSLGSVFVHDGAAELHLTNPPQWLRTVTAVYHGSASLANAQASTDVTPAATGTLPGFTVTASPTSLSLTPGQYGTVALTVTSQNGFSEQVNLSCSGLPGAAFCYFNPTVLTPQANGSGSSAMQITTMATSGVDAKNTAPAAQSGRGLYAALIPGALALVGLGALRRRKGNLLRFFGMLLLLTAGTLGVSACNPRYRYLNYQPSPNYGTAAGSYSINIAAYATDGTSITYATSSDSSCSGAVCVALTVQ